MFVVVFFQFVNQFVLQQRWLFVTNCAYQSLLLLSTSCYTYYKTINNCFNHVYREAKRNYIKSITRKSRSIVRIHHTKVLFMLYFFISVIIMKIMKVWSIDKSIWNYMQVMLTQLWHIISIVMMLLWKVKRYFSVEFVL